VRAVITDLAVAREILDSSTLSPAETASGKRIRVLRA
jgi:hypothetical protein